MGLVGVQLIGSLMGFILPGAFARFLIVSRTPCEISLGHRHSFIASIGFICQEHQTSIKSSKSS